MSWLDEGEGIFGYIQSYKAGTDVKKLTVERSTTSKYQFLLLVDFLHNKLDKPLHFIPFTKADSTRIVSLIEEHSLWGPKAIYVIEGANKKFIDSLSIPEGTTIIAETDNGDLKSSPFTYQGRKEAIRVLRMMREVKINLRPLLKMNWENCRDYSEIDPIMRKSALLDWTEEEMDNYLNGKVEVSVLTDLKRGRLEKLLRYEGTRSSALFLARLQEMLASLMVYKSYKQLGYDETKLKREMMIGKIKARELEEADKIFSIEEIDYLARKLINMDRLVRYKKDLAARLLILKSGVSVRSR